MLVEYLLSLGKTYQNSDPPGVYRRPFGWGQAASSSCPNMAQ